MVYPWSKKPKEEEVKEEETPKEEEEVKKEETLSDTETNEDFDSLILNILKLDGYKMDSGELFQAFREAGGEMEDFKNELDKLSETGKIKSDSDGNIMTVQDFKHEKSQQEEEQADVTKEEDVEEATKEKDSEGDDKAEDIEDESEEYTAEEERKKISDIRILDILRVSREIFVPEKLNFVLVGPYTSELQTTLQEIVRDF